MVDNGHLLGMAAERDLGEGSSCESDGDTSSGSEDAMSESAATSEAIDLASSDEDPLNGSVSDPCFLLSNRVSSSTKNYQCRKRKEEMIESSESTARCSRIHQSSFPMGNHKHKHPENPSGVNSVDQAQHTPLLPANTVCRTPITNSSPGNCDLSPHRSSFPVSTRPKRDQSYRYGPKNPTWTKKEDALILCLKPTSLPQCEKYIHQFPGRSKNALRTRFFRLNTNLKNGAPHPAAHNTWTEYEDQLLRFLRTCTDKSYKEMAHLFDGRSANAISIHASILEKQAKEQGDDNKRTLDPGQTNALAQSDTMSRSTNSTDYEQCPKDPAPLKLSESVEAAGSSHPKQRSSDTGEISAPPDHCIGAARPPYGTPTHLSDDELSTPAPLRFSGGMTAVGTSSRRGSMAGF